MLWIFLLLISLRIFADIDLDAYKIWGNKGNKKTLFRNGEAEKGKSKDFLNIAWRLPAKIYKQSYYA